MKNKFRIISISFVTVLFFYFAGQNFFKTPAFAAGNLEIDWGVANNGPIFSISNMLPGDSSSKSIEASNTGTASVLVKVKGERTGGVGEDPKLETVLEITIKDGANVVYGEGSTTGPKTLADFLSENSSDGVELGSLDPSENTTYIFTVYFPEESGNEFQQKSVIFKLTFPEIFFGHIVINEVYYNVQKKYWNSSHYFRWYGYWNWEKYGDNDREHDDYDNDNDYKKKYGRHDRKRKNDEWIELYNPTNKDISIRNWTITDNHSTVRIRDNKKIKSQSSALITKDNNTWKFWDENKNALKIELDVQFGDGLNNSGDHVILKDNNGNEVDRVSWGNDITGFNPFGINPTVSEGWSTERHIAGFDTDKVLDWEGRTPPTPGY